ncbi:MAG: response regulator [Anaerolineae bacterium]|nr:response regulator [Anaerolineae bacterium]
MFDAVLTPFAVIAGILTLSICTGLILVILLQPRRERSNIYFILVLAALSVWAFGGLLRALPAELALPAHLSLGILGSGLGAAGLAMYGFTLGFCQIDTQLARALAWAAAGVYAVWLVLIWAGGVFVDAAGSAGVRGYDVQPAGWLALAVVSAYTAAALLYQWRDATERAKALRLPTILLLVGYAVNGFDALAALSIDTVLVAAAAAMIGRAMLRLQLFSPLADANRQLRIANQDLRQAIIELSGERDKVKALNEELRDASRYKSEFLANMSHELRTPLNSIVGYSELLLQDLYGPLSDKQRDRLEKVHRNGRNLLVIINDILDLSKIEAGRLEMSTALVDIQPVVDEVLPVIEPQASAKQLTLEVEVASPLPQIVADGVRVRQVLINLLSNAVKFTQQGGVRLRVRTLVVKNGQSAAMPLPILGWLSDGVWVVVSVTDTGIGIAPENQAEIFEEFRQIDSSASREFEGTGLGLAITKKLVEMHRGRIWVKSALGQGSTFFVALPAETADAAAFEPAPPVVAEADRQTVLVLHDDPKIAETLAAYLATEGYNTINAHDNKTCFELAREHAPDAIMVDITMSGMKGWQLISDLKADPDTADIPLIVGSIIDGEPVGFALGPTTYITKPVQQELLRDSFTCLSVKPSGLPVMLVEDNPDERDIVETYLSAEGYQVMAASSAREAINWLAVFKMSMIVIDLLMDEMSGFEVLAHLRQEKRLLDVPVVVISAQLTTEEEDAFNVSIADVIRQHQRVRHDLLQQVIKLMA